MCADELSYFCEEAPWNFGVADSGTYDLKSSASQFAVDLLLMDARHSAQASVLSRCGAAACVDADQSSRRLALEPAKEAVGPRVERIEEHQRFHLDVAVFDPCESTFESRTVRRDDDPR